MNMFYIHILMCVMFFAPRELTACNTSKTNSTQLPRDWDAFCTSLHTNNVFKIVCHVTKQNVWNFIHFRNWTGNLNQSEVQLTVTCEKNVVISLPFPYRARYLKTLSVHGCTLRNFGSEAGHVNLLNISDSLHIVDITSCLIEINFTRYLSWRVQPDISQLECGPLNVEKYIFRNVSFIIVGSERFTSNQSRHVNIMDLMSERISSAVHLKHTCDMNNLILMDFSSHRRSSPFTFENSIINSLYPRLELLNLSQSGHREIPVALTTWRYRLGQLRILDLSFNNISRFHLRGMGTSGSAFGLINLTHNNIRTVTEAEIASFLRVNNALIDIRDNPLLCDCSMANFTRFLHEFKTPASAGLNKKYTYLWKLACSSPDGYRGQTISHLTSDDLCNHDVSVYTVYIAILSAFVVLLFLLIFLITRYRKEIRILAFTRLHITLPFHSDDVKGRKQFDAFISYSYLDSKWVIQTLLPRLENPVSGPHFRLCLHQRDFAVGAAIADNIVESIESSRHTVLVLSGNFLRSEWCLMEFRTAFHQSLLEKKNYLIPVMLENITHAQMNGDLRRCLNTVTYIKVNHRLFWDHIIYALTDKTTSHRKKKTRQQKSVLNTKSDCQLNNDMSNTNRNRNRANANTDAGSSIDMENCIGDHNMKVGSLNNAHISKSLSNKNGCDLAFVESVDFEKCMKTSCVNFGFEHSEKVTSV